MLKRIETSEVIRRASQAFDEHNRDCPEVTHKRRTARGEIQVSRKVGLIPEAITTTFHTILTEYVHNYNRMRDLMPLDMQDPANPPALLTNNVRIAKYARCTDRTVRNHVTRLRNLGFIQTRFRGSKHNFELWITPGFLFGEAKPESAENPQKTAPFAPQHKNFPHSSTHGETSGKEKGSADMLIIHGENIHGERGKTEGETPALCDVTVSRREDKEGGGARLEKSEIVAQNDRNRRQRASQLLNGRMAKAPGNVQDQFLSMLFEFWFYAWQVIYPKRQFSKEQQEKALLAISKGVYDDFTGDENPDQWRSYHQTQLAKLDKAGRYYDNHPDAYRPDPYAVHIPGKGYFDAENSKGFIGINAWIKKDWDRHTNQRRAYAERQEAKVRRAETLLRTARRDFEKVRQQAKPRKEVAKLDQLGLFQYYNTVFASLGKKWQEAFCNQFLQQQARDFQPPVYYKPRKLRAAAGEPATIVHIEPWMQDDGQGYYITDF